MAEHPAAEPRTADHADRVADRVTVMGALDTLPDEQRRVIVQLYYRGRTVTETAAALGIPSGTVKCAQPSCAPRAASDVRGSPSGTARRAGVGAVRRAGTHMHVDHASPVLVEPAQRLRAGRSCVPVMPAPPPEPVARPMRDARARIA